MLSTEWNGAGRTGGKPEGAFHWMKRSMHCRATVYQKPLAPLLCWEGAALIMPNASGIIKAESAPMFSADFKWTFYIYRLNRRCVLLGQPNRAAAPQQPKSHVHMARVPCDTQAEHLHQTWVRTHLRRLLAHSSVPKSWLRRHGTCLHLTQCLWAMPVTHTSP